MKLKTAIFPLLTLAGALSLAFAQHDEPKLDVSPDKIAKIDAALPDKAPAPVKKKHEVLVFSRTTGFRHGSIPVGAEMLKRMGDKTGLFHVTHTEDESAFEADSLAKYDAVIMLNTTGEIFLNAAKDVERENRLKKNLLDFVSSGKGLMGVHSATDTYHGWREYNDMMGGTFDSHPWGSGTTERIRNLDPKNPVNASFNGEGFTIKDEIYKFRKDTALPTERRIILALDPNGTDMSLDTKDKRELYPVAWLDTWGKGRVFYCSLGHNDEIYMNPAIVKHYLAGLQFALGELEADAAPQAVINRAQLSDGLN